MHLIRKQVPGINGLTMNTSDKSNDKDILLDLAQELASDLPDGAKNEMRRVLNYFMKHNDLENMLEMLKKPIPQYGHKAIERWIGVRKTLISKKSKLKKYSPDQIAYILGWAARILK